MPTTTKPTEPELSQMETSTLAVEADGLVLHRGRGSHTIAWHTIRGLHYPRSGQAELELADGTLVPLPMQGAELEALVDAIGAHCKQALAHLRRLPDDPAAVRQALGIAPGGAIVVDDNRDLLLVAPLAGLGSLICLVGGTPAYRPIYAVALLASLVGLLASTRRWFSVTKVNEQGISSRGLFHQWSVGWAEVIRSVSHHQESLDKLSIELVTPAGTFTVSGPPHVLRPVATTAELVVAARTAEFTMADRDAPDTALSPAQRSDQDAERGLSQTAR